jgi:hypothetical protein
MQAAPVRSVGPVDDVVEPISVTTPRRVGRGVLAQWWRDLTFVHWAVEPAAVAGLLPAGTRPDVLGGVTYVGLVPFRMDRVRPFGGPAVPYLGSFCETNVRLYSVDAEGRRGVVFRSLDAARLVPALAGRLGFSLPYRWSSMRLRQDGDVFAYRCRTRWRGTESTLMVRTGPTIQEPTELEQFLTARWGLHVSWHGRTLYVPNDHPQWPLNRATLLHLSDELVAAAGVPVSGEPVSVLFSPGVPARFGAPRRVR